MFTQFRGSPPVTDLKTVKCDEEVNSTLALFLGDRHDIKQRLVARLNEIRSKLDRSHYFKTHEVSAERASWPDHFLSALAPFFR